MTVRVIEFPENSGHIALMKSLAEGMLKQAAKLPERWWPKRVNNMPVEFFGTESCTITMEMNAKHRVDFTYGYEDGKPVWVLVETLYDNPHMSTSDFILCLPR